MYVCEREGQNSHKEMIGMKFFFFLLSFLNPQKVFLKSGTKYLYSILNTYSRKEVGKLDDIIKH